MGILTSRTRLNSSLKNWSSSFERHCRDVNPAGEGSLRPGQTCSQARPSGISLEATPLEIDFISGPRIGERLLLNDRPGGPKGTGPELKVEEAELSRWWIPSPTSSVLSELFETNR
eukprot:g10669.t1